MLLLFNRRAGIASIFSFFTARPQRLSLRVGFPVPRAVFFQCAICTRAMATHSFSRCLSFFVWCGLVV